MDIFAYKANNWNLCFAVSVRAAFAAKWLKIWFIKNIKAPFLIFLKNMHSQRKRFDGLAKTHKSSVFQALRPRRKNARLLYKRTLSRAYQVRFTARAVCQSRASSYRGFSSLLNAKRNALPQQHLFGRQLKPLIKQNNNCAFLKVIICGGGALAFSVFTQAANNPLRFYCITALHRLTLFFSLLRGAFKGCKCKKSPKII